MRFIPGGTMIESVWVRATPIIPAFTAISTNQAQAPQCELLRATTAPTPLSFAIEMASCMAVAQPLPHTGIAVDHGGRRAGAPRADAGPRLTVPLRRRVA